MSFETINREIKDYGINKLSKETGVSRSNIYGIMNGEVSPSLATYQKLTERLGYQLELTKKQPMDMDPNYLIWSLASWGAPIMTEGHYSPPMDLNLLLIKSLSKGREEPRINTILPFFIYKNWDKFKWPKIMRETSERQYLSYLINIIFHITNDLKTNSILAELQTYRIQKKKQFLIKSQKQSRFELKRFEITDNKIAKSWNYQTADDLSSITQRFNKWLRASA